MIKIILWKAVVWAVHKKLLKVEGTLVFVNGLLTMCPWSELYPQLNSSEIRLMQLVAIVYCSVWGCTSSERVLRA